MGRHPQPHTGDERTGAAPDILGRAFHGRIQDRTAEVLRHGSPRIFPPHGKQLRHRRIHRPETTRRLDKGHRPEHHTDPSRKRHILHRNVDRLLSLRRHIRDSTAPCLHKHHGNRSDSQSRAEIRLYQKEKSPQRPAVSGLRKRTETQDQVPAHTVRHLFRGHVRRAEIHGILQ